MRAIRLNNNQLSYDADVATPKANDGEVLIRVIQAGICSTDLELVKGYMGFNGILGHEFVGIAETGKFTSKRVVGEINCCLQADCQGCSQHGIRHCPSRTVLGILNRDGAFADYVSLPEKNLFEVPDSVPTEEAVFVEPLAAAFQILEQIDVTPAMHVAVIGDGRLGFLCAQVLANTGCQLRVIGKHAEKLKLFDELGIATEIPHGIFERDCDVVVDCTGSNSGMETAYQLVKPKGTIVLKTTVAGTPTFSIAPIVIDEIRVIGSRCGLFPPAINALEGKTVAVTPLITRRYPLEAAIEAFESCKEAGTMKVLFDVSDE